MIYERMRQAVFLERPNRFIARICLGGREEICHVKNTGRCRELLLPGARIMVQENKSPARKTGWDLIAVWKGKRLINMDAAAPNQVFAEWAKANWPGLTLLRPETVHLDSRFDFYLEAAGRPAFVEVKGVTLEEGGVARFPDAPTERGLKHIRGLTASKALGYDAYAAFIIQMADVAYFEPNWATHAAFGLALQAAAAAGVTLLAWDCGVTENSICLRQPVEIRL